MYIPVRYKPLLKGRNLAFYSKYVAAFSAIVTAKTPHIIALKNPTSGIITIPSVTGKEYLWQMGMARSGIASIDRLAS